MPITKINWFSFAIIISYWNNTTHYDPPPILLLLIMYRAADDFMDNDLFFLNEQIDFSTKLFLEPREMIKEKMELIAEYSMKNIHITHHNGRVGWPVSLYGWDGHPAIDPGQKFTEDSDLFINIGKPKENRPLPPPFEHDLPLWFLDHLFATFNNQMVLKERHRLFPYSDTGFVTPRMPAVWLEYGPWKINRTKLALAQKAKRVRIYPWTCDLVAISLVCIKWYNLVAPVHHRSRERTEPFRQFRDNSSYVTGRIMNPILRETPGWGMRLCRFEKRPPMHELNGPANYMVARGVDKLKIIQEEMEPYDRPVEPFATQSVGFDAEWFIKNVLSWLSADANFEAGFMEGMSEPLEEYSDDSLASGTSIETQLVRFQHYASSAFMYSFEVPFFRNLRVKINNRWDMINASPSLMTLISFSRTCKWMYQFINEAYFARCDTCDFLWFRTAHPGLWTTWTEMFGNSIPFCVNCREINWDQFFEAALACGWDLDLATRDEYTYMDKPVVQVKALKVNLYDDPETSFQGMRNCFDPAVVLKRKREEDEAWENRKRRKVY